MPWCWWIRNWNLYLLAADPTLAEDADDWNTEDFAPLPEDPELRDEVLRQQLVHGVLRSRALGIELDEPARRGEGLGSPGLESLLEDLPARPPQHPGVWAVLKGPVLLLAVLVTATVLVGSLKDGPDAMVKQLTQFLESGESEDMVGGLTVSGSLLGSAREEQRIDFSRFWFRGQDRFHAISEDSGSPWSETGFDGQDFWADPFDASEADPIRVESDSNQSEPILLLDGFPAGALRVGRYLAEALEHPERTLEPATEGEESDWMLRVESVGDGIEQFEARIDGATSRPEAVEFDVRIEGREFHVSVRELRTDVPNRQLYRRPDPSNSEPR
ncbi:MAG: hypothetical protein AAF196_20005 [Planctomycetota bacterium]